MSRQDSRAPHLAPGERKIRHSVIHVTGCCCRFCDSGRCRGFAITRRERPFCAVVSPEERVPGTRSSRVQSKILTVAFKMVSSLLVSLFHSFRDIHALRISLYCDESCRQWHLHV